MTAYATHLDVPTAGDRRRQARETYGYSQEEWASQLGVSVEDIQEWERDGTRCVGEDT